MAGLASPALAAGFLLGCACLYAMRRHAEQVGVMLTGFAVYLGICLVLTSTAGSAPAVDLADPPACYGFD